MMQIERSYTGETQQFGDGRMIFLEGFKGEPTELYRQVANNLQYNTKSDEINALLCAYHSELKRSKMITSCEFTLSNKLSNLHDSYWEKLKKINRDYEGVRDFAVITEEDKADAFTRMFMEKEELKRWYAEMWNNAHKVYYERLADIEKEFVDEESISTLVLAEEEEELNF